jgi:hypothetical protein
MLTRAEEIYVRIRQHVARHRDLRSEAIGTLLGQLFEESLNFLRGHQCVDLGPRKAKFHLPIKTSTRERVIQVWAHQRVLDGVYGTGRFLGTPVILAETKTDSKSKKVVEICLPDQWLIYQMHIAQLKRVYYLDVPVPYARLAGAFPRLYVRAFGDFFHEVDTLID